MALTAQSIHALLRDTFQERGVREQAADDEGWLVAEATDSGVLLTVGMHGGRVSPEELLARRGRSLDLYGRWLPAQLGDGSLVVVCRLTWAQATGPQPVSADEVEALRLLLR